MQLPAFTLIEMLVVLALSTIVVALAWSVYAHFHLFALEFQKRSADSATFLSFDQHIRHDARMASDLQAEHAALRFLDGEGNTQATYTRFPEGLVRGIPEGTLRNGPVRSDTFRLDLQGWHLELAHGTKRIGIQIGPATEETPHSWYTVHLPATAISEL
jgi:prepilin-type N-terminal cleavage/methylation domain-containing protein